MRIYKRAEVSNKRQNSFTTGTMKFTVALFAVLAVFGLGQAHQFPDFGKGPLHEHIQDFLDLIPAREIQEVIFDYYENDTEVRNAFDYLGNSTLVGDLWSDIVSIPELYNLIDYLRKEGIGSSVRIHQFVLADAPVHKFAKTQERTGGIAGLFKDVRQLIDYDDHISLYADKIQTSPTLVRFMKELSSDNTQQIVNKIYKSRNFQFIRNYLKRVKVNVKIAEDIMYLVFGLTVPPKTLVEEFQDFFHLLPLKQILSIYEKYLNGDEKVRQAFAFLLTPEFHGLQRTLENLKEYNAVVIFFEKAGVPIVEQLQVFHRAIGMDDYVPAYLEQFLQQSKGKSQEVGEGIKAMIEDILNVLPVEEIDALFYEKLDTSDTFYNFVAKLISRELKAIGQALSAKQAYKQYVSRTFEVGLDLYSLSKLGARIIGITNVITI